MMDYYHKFVDRWGGNNKVVNVQKLVVIFNKWGDL